MTQSDPNADPALAQAHAHHAGSDARISPGYIFLHVTPTRIQAWRNPAELAHRDVMRGGRWSGERNA